MHCFLQTGDGMKSASGYMASSVLVGLLNSESGCCPNLINVLSLAKESGIEVQCHLIVTNATQQQGVCLFVFRGIIVWCMWTDPSGKPNPLCIWRGGWWSVHGGGRGQRLQLQGHGCSSRWCAGPAGAEQQCVQTTGPSHWESAVLQSPCESSAPFFCGRWETLKIICVKICLVELNVFE